MEEEFIKHNVIIKQNAKSVDAHLQRELCYLIVLMRKGFPYPGSLILVFPFALSLALAVVIASNSFRKSLG